MRVKRKIRELGRKATAGLLAGVLVVGNLLGLVGPAVQAAYGYTLTGSKYWNEALGIDMDTLTSSMEAHSGSYLGVPYSQMVCSQFVQRAMRDAGYGAAAETGYTVTAWMNWASSNGIKTYTTYSRDEVIQLGREGKIHKGDIVFTRSDAGDWNHMGYYWGDASNGYDAMWHSITMADGVTYNRNAITPIAGKYGSKGFVILPAEPPTVTVSFTKCSAETTVTDGNSNYSVRGAEYDIYSKDTNQIVQHIVMDSNGKASYQLKPGWYYAVETKAPKGFTLNPNPTEPFYAGNQGASATLEDDPATVRITIGKKDAATLGEAQDGATLAGAEYKVTSLSTPGWTATGTTNEQGQLIVRDIPLGKLTVQETKAPTGYKLDPTVYEYEATPTDNQIQISGGIIEMEPEDDFKESVIAFNVEIAKFKGEDDTESGLENPAAGVVFQIISNTTGEVVGELTTNDAGYADSSTDETLWFGDGTRPATVSGAIPYDDKGYTIHEVEETVPDGYGHVGDWTISAEDMVDGAKLQYIVDDHILSTHLQVVKVDADSGQTVALSGFKFQILDENKVPVTQDVWYPNHAEISEFVTDESGCVTLPQGLKPGTYYIHEVEAVAPYLLNTEDVQIAIPNDPDLSPVVIARFADDDAVGRATIVKSCVQQTPSEGDIDPECGGTAGAEFDVVAAEDVIGADGLVHYAEDAVADHVVIGEDGTATTGDLQLGVDGTADFEFVETKAAPGHALDETPIPVTLSWVDDETPVVTAKVQTANHANHAEIEKVDAGTGKALADAVFALWDADDEVSLPALEGNGTVAIRVEGTDGSEKVTIDRDPEFGKVDLSAVELEASIELVNADGEASTPVEDATDMYLYSGEYTVKAYVDGPLGSKIEAPLTGDTELEVETGRTYKVAVSETGEVELTEGDETFADEVELAYDADADAYVGIAPDGTWNLTVGEADMGEIECASGYYGTVSLGGLTQVPVLLKSGVEPYIGVTDDEGKIDIQHLEEGTYRVRELDAPEGYVVSDEVFELEVGADGVIDPEKLTVEDDFTKVDISKVEVTGGEELPGAELEVRDAAGELVDAWTSGEEPHRIERLEPGRYTLIEKFSPRTHDVAEEIEFTVEETGEVQTVEMTDEPIQIDGQIDKREEIADPTAADTDATAEVTGGDEGAYDYSVDYRSTSNTWADELTMTDELDAVVKGLAELKGITTPVLVGDTDGLLNVWYKTDKTAEDHVDESGANATDLEANPWLTTEEVIAEIGEDGRAVDYTGWRLWAADVDATTATELKVSDLGLEEGEKVTAIRIEHGHVDEGASTRADGWDREALKDALDTIVDVTDDHTEGEAALAVHMKVTDAYVEGTELLNSASVDVYRNGGDDRLEAHDADEVKQAPKTFVGSLMQTGASLLGPTAAMALTAGVAMGGYELLRRREREE